MVALAACMAAAALQAGALQIAATVIGRESIGAGRTGAARRVLQIAPAREAAEAPPATLSAAAIPPRAREPQKVVPQAGADAAPPLVDDEGTAASRRPFYEFREVDVPAEPVRDWNLDPAALDQLATSRIVFTLFVASDGTPLHCSVDEPDRLTPAVRRDLAERLCATAMRPARRGGDAVASRRRVELFTTGGV